MNIKLFKKDYECEPLRIKYARYQSLKEEADNFICRQLGYTIAECLVEKITPSFTDAKFKGAINYGHENRLSQCSTITASDGSCSKLSHIKCEFFK